MSDYLFHRNAEDRELGRLRLIEAAVDADTIGLLEDTGVSGGWRCLELGAGAGSIAEWLGTRVGPEGLVVAVDRKASYLRRFSSSPYRVVEGDFRTLTLDGTVDLLHARAAMHLCPGDAPIARVMAESALVLRQEYTGTGVATDEDLDRYVAHAGDTRRWSVYYSTVSIIARVR